MARATLLAAVLVLLCTSTPVAVAAGHHTHCAHHHEHHDAHVEEASQQQVSRSLRRLLDNVLSGLSGPNSFLAQTKRASSLTTQDLQETQAHAADFSAPIKGRSATRDRRLLDNVLSGLSGPNSFLAQTKRASSLTTQDLQETQAHAADFSAPVKGRSATRDRRLLGNVLSGLSGPNSFLAQTKRASSLTTQDLQETQAHAADFSAPVKGRSAGRDRRLLGVAAS